MSKRIDTLAVPAVAGCTYPAPFHLPCMGRSRQRLGDAAGLEKFGVNLMRLPPGAWSSQRHWHLREDEFVYIVEGEVVLVTDEGEETLRAGDSAGFKGGIKDGHHLQNRSSFDVLILEVGSRDPEDEGEYSDIDMRFERRVPGYARKDGIRYL